MVDGEDDGGGRGWEATRARALALVAEARCWRDAGEALTPSWLASGAAWLAEAAAGWEALHAEVPPTRRYRSIAASPDLECWLIAWPPGGRLQLHDHGGAAGALQVVSGTLHESGAVAAPAGPDGRRRLERPLRTRVLGAGSGVSFASSYVHDVVGAPGGLATSVHVYSAAVGPMRFWAASRGMLVPAPPEPPDAAEVVEGPTAALAR